MDDILEHKGRREITSLTTRHATILPCKCGKPGDRFDNRYPTLRFCVECYARELDRVTLSMEEGTRRIFAKQQLSNGDVVNAEYTARSIEEIVAAHTTPATPPDMEPLRV